MQSSTARNEISLLGPQQSDSIWVFPPSHHHYTLFFLVCSPIWILPEYHKTAAFQQRELPKESHMCTKPQSISRTIKTIKATPVCRQLHNWDELQVWCGSDALGLCGMSTEHRLFPLPAGRQSHTTLLLYPSTLLAFFRYCELPRNTGTMEREAEQIGIKLVHSQDWDHNPCSTLEVLKLVKVIHHKLCVYKVKCPAKWDYSANNAVLDGAVKGHNSRWDDYVSQLLRLITRFTFSVSSYFGWLQFGCETYWWKHTFLKKAVSYLWTPIVWCLNSLPISFSNASCYIFPHLSKTATQAL